MSPSKLALGALLCISPALFGCGKDETAPAATSKSAATATEPQTPAPAKIEPEAPAPSKTREGEPLAKESAGAPEKSDAPKKSEGSGAIRGTVSFSGNAPERKEIPMGAVAGCPHDAPTLGEELIVTNGKLANVFVRIKTTRGLTPPPAPTEPVYLDQKGCMYRPHVSGMRAGQQLVVRNDDPATHNVNARPQRPANHALNQTQPQGTAPLEMVFGDPEVMVPFGCDVHPWMKAWIGVVDHPWFAVTGEDGAFVLRDVPAGKYELEFWHEKLGRQTSEVIVAAGADARADATFAGK